MLKDFIKALVIWVFILIFRLVYFNINCEYSSYSLSHNLLAFRFSLFFFSPFLIVILIMQYLVRSREIKGKNLFIFSFSIFGILGAGYFYLASPTLDITDQSFKEAIFALIVGVIFWAYNNIIWRVGQLE